MSIGKFLLNFQITWFEIIMIVLFASFIEHLLLFIKNKTLTFFSYSAINTALGVLFLIRSTDVYIYLIVITIALTQKYFLKINNTHFLNPSNVAVVVALAFFPYQTYTTPEQWGSFLWLGTLMFILGFFITTIVKRTMIPLSFAFFYITLNYLFLTHNIYDLFNTIISGSFLLFIFFMLTDPRTSPTKYSIQVLYTLSISLLTLLFELFIGHDNIHMFLALFIISLSVPLLRKLETSTHIKTVTYTLYMFLFISIITLYFSPYNYIKNIKNSSITSFLIHNSKAELVDHEVYPNEIWSSQNNTLYKTDWNQSHIIAVTLQKQNTKSEKKFTKIDTIRLLNSYLPNITEKEFGLDYLHNNSITVGDINHDGLLDVVLCKPNTSIKIFINQGNQNFLDATKLLFNNIPFNIAHVALADMNNDSYLDLILLRDSYKVARDNTILLFNSTTKMFDTPINLTQKSLGTKGGLALYDLNSDKILDLFISNGVNYVEHDFLAQGIVGSGNTDELWISNNHSWIDEKKYNLPNNTTSFAGMSVAFSDINHDGFIDFLLANDYQPDITMLGDKQGNFNLINKSTLQYNTLDSMSYFSIDINNDGVFELWENCISTPKYFMKDANQAFMEQTHYKNDVLTQELIQLEDDFRRGDINCNKFSDPLSSLLCKRRQSNYKAKKLSNANYCSDITNLQALLHCKSQSVSFRFRMKQDPRKRKLNSELYPKTISNNILLKKDSQGHYKQSLQDFSVIHTGWSWAAYPYDIDNNGFQDIYITTGSILYYLRQPNALLMNYSTKDIKLKNETKHYAVDDLDESRGLIIADFDNDGDGDIFINNIFKEAVLYDNKTGGNSITISLRSKEDNYYAVGSILYLHTNKGVQTREMNIGGIYNSYQPPQIHFGLANNEVINYLEIIWPNGKKQKISDLNKNNLYIIYK
jgi:Na+-translocating ferredoxin:NAD+ oxidoreductase RnfD subunit